MVLTEAGVGGIRGGLVHGGVADEDLVAGERHDGRREALALVVGDDLNAAVPPHGHARVGRTEVDAYRRNVALGGGHHLLSPREKRGRPGETRAVPVDY